MSGRKPRFTQYEMDRYLSVRGGLSAKSASGKHSWNTFAYVPYDPEEIREILRLRKEAYEAGKPLLTFTQRTLIGYDYKLDPAPEEDWMRDYWGPEDGNLLTSDVEEAAKLWIKYYNDHKDDGKLLHSAFAEETKGRLKDSTGRGDAGTCTIL